MNAVDSGGDAPYPWEADDARFVEAVESCTLPKERFGHRAHLRLAWLYLRAGAYEEAVQRMERSIMRYATHLGAAQKYHRTLTITWMRLVAAALEEPPRTGSFDAFLEAHCELLDARITGRHYRAELLSTPAARASLIEPDLAPLPPTPAPVQARVATTSRYSASTLVALPVAMLCEVHSRTSSARSFSFPAGSSDANARDAGP